MQHIVNITLCSLKAEWREFLVVYGSFFFTFGHVSNTYQGMVMTITNDDCCVIVQVILCRSFYESIAGAIVVRSVIPLRRVDIVRNWYVLCTSCVLYLYVLPALFNRNWWIVACSNISYAIISCSRCAMMYSFSIWAKSQEVNIF